MKRLIILWAMALLACASYAQVGGPGTVTLPGVLGGAAVDLSGYVLLVGDADGQTIQGRTGSNQARIELGIGVDPTNVISIFGGGATAASIYASDAYAGLLSPDESSYVDVSNSGIDVVAVRVGVISSQTPPTNANDACTAGDFIPTTGFIYFCVATNTWQRVAIATWP